MSDGQEESIFTRSRRSYVYESARGSNNRNRVILIFVGLIILILLVVIAVVATGGKGDQDKSLTPTPTKPIETPTPIPTETPALTPGKGTPTPTAKITPTPSKTSGLDRSLLTIAIKNGSGTAGAATKASNYLKGLGYDIVSSGNADSFDYANTTIQIKASKKAYLDQLKKDLSANYTVGSTSANLTSGSADAIVVVGKE